MASMDALYGDSQSPDVQPTSLEAVPSSPSTAPPIARPPLDAQPAPRAKVTRTYGRKVVDSSTAPDAQKDAAYEDAARALDRHSTVVIPDSEPAPLAAPLAHSSSDSDDGDRTLRAAPAATTSSPTRLGAHSTDPTSEDEEPVRPACARSKASKAVMDVDSDGDSSDDGASGDETGALAFLKRRPALEDLLADVDREFDARPEDSTPAAKLPTSSSLPPLTITNDSGASRPSTSSQRSPSPGARRRAAVPSSPSNDLDDIEALLGSTQTAPSEEVVPTSRSGARKSRAIIDSEDEDDDAPLPSRPKPRAASTAVPASSDGDEAQQPTMSRREKVRELWDKRVAVQQAKDRQHKMDLAAARGEEYVEPAEEPVEEDDFIEDSEGRSAKKPAKARKPTEKKTKSLSKKVLEEMNRETAALNRQQEARLVATRKVGLSVADALKQINVSSLPMPSIDRTASTYAPPATITLSSSSDAIVTSSPSHDLAQTPLPKLSLKALGKQRATSPIGAGDLDTPVPHRVRKPLPPAGWPERKKAPTPDEDDDDELLAPDEMIRRDHEKREKARRQEELQARKRAALAAAKQAAASAAQDDSDSDLEIEMPGAARAIASRSRALKHEDTLAAFAHTPARPRNDPRKLLARHAGIDIAHPPSDDVLPSESQLDAAGHEFGRHLDSRFHENLTSARKSRGIQSLASGSTSSRPKKASRPVEITREMLDMTTLEKARLQAIKERMKKRTRARQQQESSQAEKQELQSVDVNALLKNKREQEQQEDEQEEDEDGDYVDADEQEAYGSGDASSGEEASGAEDEPAAPLAAAGSAGEEDEGEVDSEGELVMPRSSQNSDRLRHVADEAEDEDEEMPPPATTRRPVSKIRIVADDDDETQSSVTPASTELAPTEVVKTPSLDSQAAAPAKVAFGGLLGAAGDDAGGFSQFFDSQFSQGAGGDDQTDGFFRPAENDFTAPAPTLFAAQPLITDAERAADAARLEARGGFNDFEPGTPRELPAPRQYINEKGFLTQTRPAIDSPSDSPAFFRHSLSTRDSQSQALDETQLASAQTPTQLSKDPNRLRRAGALTSFDSLGPLAATEIQPEPTELASSRARSNETQVEETQLADETQEETQDTLPSAAQPTAPRNAFDALKAGATQVDVPAQGQQQQRRRARNAFVDAEANLSDEEVGLGLGGVSGDEDEAGHDAELESLVDNEEVDRDVQVEQDKLARDRFAEDEAKAEAEAMKRAQRVVDGKERQKRGAYDLSDDDFDDEYVSRNGHREKKARVESLTIGQLKENEETQAFAEVLAQGFVATTKAGEFAYLETAHNFSDGDEDDAADGDDEMDGGVQDVFGRVDAPELRVRSFKEAQTLAVEQSRARRALEEDEDVEMLGREEELEDRVLRDLSPQFNLETSSPAAPPVKLNLKHVAATTTIVQTSHLDEYADIDSQGGIFGIQHGTAVKYNERDESSIATATVTGNRSSVTSFRRTAAAATTTTTKGAAKGKASTSLGPKPSKLGAVRRGGFA
ncbi:hypothetical protein JCM10450v2_004482 [Rhodotorula kratochvilovae]